LLTQVGRLHPPFCGPRLAVWDSRQGDELGEIPAVRFGLWLGPSGAREALHAAAVLRRSG
jgi:hypothetical protein